MVRFNRLCDRFGQPWEWRGCPGTHYLCETGTSVRGSSSKTFGCIVSPRILALNKNKMLRKQPASKKCKMRKGRDRQDMANTYILTHGTFTERRHILAVLNRGWSLTSLAADDPCAKKMHSEYILGNGDARRRIVKKTNLARFLPGAEPPIQLRLEKIAGCCRRVGRIVGKVVVRGREVSCRQYETRGVPARLCPTFAKAGAFSKWKKCRLWVKCGTLL
ncbi:hypothetical protein B0H11DRAFT_1922742 [Mycena galericulata]|nr:hypothetical protein B0H11DRAFT_1922742 [Mycena galericulata]